MKQIHLSQDKSDKNTSVLKKKKLAFMPKKGLPLEQRKKKNNRFKILAAKSNINSSF